MDAQTQNFTALQMVTGIFAARLVLDTLQQPLISQILGSLWSSFCVAYISIGAPEIDFAMHGIQQTQTPNWAIGQFYLTVHCNLRTIT
jgi:hypothetical protein